MILSASKHPLPAESQNMGDTCSGAQKLCASALKPGVNTLRFVKSWSATGPPGVSQVVQEKQLQHSLHYFRCIAILLDVSDPDLNLLLEHLRSAEANGNYRILATAFCLGHIARA